MYYLRDRKGKSARISEKIKKKIGIDVSEQITEKEFIQGNIANLNENKAQLDNKKVAEKIKKEELKKEELKTQKK